VPIPTARSSTTRQENRQVAAGAAILFEAIVLPMARKLDADCDLISRAQSELAASAAPLPD
jgi:hypothetical protein